MSVSPLKKTTLNFHFPLFFTDISLPTNNHFAKNRDQKGSEMERIANNPKVVPRSTIIMSQLVICICIILRIESNVKNKVNN